MTDLVEPKFKFKDRVITTNDTLLIGTIVGFRPPSPMSELGPYVYYVLFDGRNIPNMMCESKLSKCDGYVHASLMFQFAKDASRCKKPWLLWEFYDEFREDWMGLKMNPRFQADIMYRRKKNADELMEKINRCESETDTTDYAELRRITEIMDGTWC